MVLQKTPVAVIFPTASGIKKLTDLYGKTLGVTMTSVAEKQWRYVEKYNKLDTSKINEVSIGTGHCADDRGQERSMPRSHSSSMTG